MLTLRNGQCRSETFAIKYRGNAGGEKKGAFRANCRAVVVDMCIQQQQNDSLDTDDEVGSTREHRVFGPTSETLRL